MVAIAAFRMILPFVVNRKLLGSANVPLRAPFLVVSDSNALVSLMAIACEFPLPLYALTDRRPLELRVLGRILRNMNALPAEAEDGSLDFSSPLRVLRNGGGVVMFLPEVNAPAPAPDIIAAAGMLAYESAAPVAPVRVFQPVSSSGRLVVRVGRPTLFAGAVAGLSPREKYRTVGQSIQSLLSEIRN